MKKSLSLDISIGSGKEKINIIENLALLIASGMGIDEAIGALKRETKSGYLRKKLERVEVMLENGLSLWRALKRTELFPEHVVALIRIGERTGKLSDNLKIAAEQERKAQTFRGKIYSAMMYPVFILVVTVSVGIGTAWFILPRLATVFSQLDIELPLLTRILIDLGQYLQANGAIVVPAFIVGLAFFIYVIFVLKYTKFIGQRFLFLLPGTGKLLREVELARLGYMLGTLLEVGLPVLQAFDSLANATASARYRKFYLRLQESIEEGNSFQKSFSLDRKSKHLVPVHIQQLIISGERSGNLADTLKQIGSTYEERLDTTTKNLSVILEPLLLVIVWVGVLGVAMAVIVPLYSLIGNLNDPESTSVQNAQPPTTPDVIEFVTPPLEIEEPESTDNVESTTIRILDAPDGFVNVHEGPSDVSNVVNAVLPGETFEFSDQLEGWYEITTDLGIGYVPGESVELVIATSTPDETDN